MSAADEPDLFGYDPPAEYPQAAGHRGVDTSVEAAAALAPKVGRLQRMTLAAIASRAVHGSTADEAADACGMDRWSIQPRVSELKIMGMIIDSGERRFNLTGKRAIVWVTPEHKRSAAA